MSSLVNYTGQVSHGHHIDTKLLGVKAKVEIVTVKELWSRFLSIIISFLEKQD